MTSPRSSSRHHLNPHLRRPGAAFRAPYPPTQLGKLEVHAVARHEVVDVQLPVMIAPHAVALSEQPLMAGDVAKSADGDAGHKNIMRTF